METANDYAATDQAATVEFARLLEQNHDEYGRRPIEDLNPPKPDDEIPTRPY